MSVRFEDELSRRGILVYTCVGTSMLPMLRQKRDLVVLKPPAGQLRKYDVALYRDGNGKYILHRVIKAGASGYVLRGDNNRTGESGIRDDQIIGVLTAFVRDGREIQVTDVRYRLYVRLWCGLFPLRAALLWCAAMPDRLKRRWKRFHERRSRDKNRKNI